MIESPLIESLLAERTQEMVLDVLRVRFGEPSIDLVTRVRGVEHSAALVELHRHAIVCPDPEAFRNRLLDG